MKLHAADFLAIALVVAAVVWPGAADSEPSEPPDLSPEAAEVAETMSDPAAAAQLAAVADEYARLIRDDGAQVEPVLRTTADLGRRFAKFNDYAFAGERLASDELVALSAAWLARLEPQGPRPLDDAVREEAAELFETIALGLRSVR